MTTITVDPDGRVTLPDELKEDELKEKAGISPGAEVEVRGQNGHLEIRATHAEGPLGETGNGDGGGTRGLKPTRAEEPWA